MPFCHQSAFYKRTIFEQFIYSKEYKIAGDYEFNLRLYKNGLRFKKLDNLVVAEFEAGGISDIKRRLSVLEDYKVRKKHKSNSIEVVLYTSKQYFRALLFDLALKLFRQ